MAVVGVNIGALTVKVVALRGDQRPAQVVAHQGRPLEALKDLLRPILSSPTPMLRRLRPSRSHLRGGRHSARAPEAENRPGAAEFRRRGVARRRIVPGLTILRDGRITNVLSHNKCAAGSGEFFVQQIGRMGLGHRRSDPAVVRRQGRAAGLALLGALQIGHHPQAQPQRGDARRTSCTRCTTAWPTRCVSLLEKGQRELQRVLLIGGVTRNAGDAGGAARRSCPARSSSCCRRVLVRGVGQALLARDEPRIARRRLSAPPSLGRLPPLHLYADRVQVIAAPPPAGPSRSGRWSWEWMRDRRPPRRCCSTRRRGAWWRRTTRARAAIPWRPRASVCGRWSIRSAIVRSALVGTTGSARELVGAYLGTEHVYNEISAHAAGATHFDPEVDTIFEIGGQDSKYIYLRNGVPIDYAMNNACSAGTGSFLEESAQGDLGIEVSDIADVALAAPSPVHFKATCAAFINSDIRDRPAAGTRARQHRGRAGLCHRGQLPDRASRDGAASARRSSSRAASR